MQFINQSNQIKQLIAQVLGCLGGLLASETETRISRHVDWKGRQAIEHQHQYEEARVSEGVVG